MCIDLGNRPSHTLNSNHLFLCNGKRAKVQGEFVEVAGVFPGQMDRHVVRIAVKLGRPHHNLEISCLSQRIFDRKSAYS